nr:chaperone protein DnaJ-like isoform X2 [Ziziphus jujuba var. spinosa]
MDLQCNYKGRGILIIKAGNLYTVLHIKEKHGIRRDGLNLYSTINVDYTEAILGTVVKFDGLRDLQIPSGIQPGETLKLSHMGVPDVNKPSIRGDHHFILNVWIPKKSVMQSMHLWRNCSRLLGKAIQFLQTALGILKGVSRFMLLYFQGILKGASTITKIRPRQFQSSWGGPKVLHLCGTQLRASWDRSDLVKVLQ